MDLEDAGMNRNVGTTGQDLTPERDQHMITLVTHSTETLNGIRKWLILRFTDTPSLVHLLTGGIILCLAIHLMQTVSKKPELV